MVKLVHKSEEQWRQELTPEQYRVLRESGTEAPGTGELLYNNEDGLYRCAACKTILFNSESKYESTMPGLIGWPSFSNPADVEAVELVPDDSLGMHRTEVRCRTCGSHLGHVFEDASSPNGTHFCINSLSLEFSVDKED